MRLRPLPLSLSPSPSSSRCAGLARLALLAIGLCTLPGVDARPPSATEERTAGEDSASYAQREDAIRFAAEVAARRGLPLAWVQAQLAQARYVPNAAKFIMPPPAGTAKNWRAYRARFVETVRLRAGVAFWRENENWLKRAEAEYGVPPEIVTGIIGVETLYGRHMGRFRTLDALSTLAFDFPPGRKDRSAFFRDELEALLVLSQREGREPSQWLGSYAGAMGMGQFMPSSWQKYAVDFDADGRIDMDRSAADVIGSVAHFLAEAGWKRGEPVRFEVRVPVDASARAQLLAPDIVPTFTAQQFSELGAGLTQAGLQHRGLLSLIELQNGDAAPSYVAGTSNFYALTRYNWSSYYAMAVIELGEEVARIQSRVR